MTRHQDALGVCQGEERRRKMESSCAAAFPGVAMKKNSFVTNGAGWHCQIPSRYGPVLVF